MYRFSCQKVADEILIVDSLKSQKSGKIRLELTIILLSRNYPIELYYLSEISHKFYKLLRFLQASLYPRQRNIDESLLE